MCYLTTHSFVPPSGPFKINACPLRRVNQIFLIATATKLDISAFGTPKHINDKYFRRIKAKRPKKEEGDIFEQKQEVRGTVLCWAGNYMNGYVFLNLLAYSSVFPVNNVEILSICL